jgi:Holliday junction resolvase RusA-like endonuclease
MSKYFDYQFGLTEIVPSKQQDVKEGEKVSAFRTLVEKTIVPEVLRIPIFPSKKEVVVFIMQFFVSKKEYDSRDVDNMGKTVLDCLKGKLFIDDDEMYKIAEPICKGLLRNNTRYEGLDINPHTIIRGGVNCAAWGP